MPDPTRVKVDAMLCNHAEAHDGLLFVNGAGITQATVSSQPPHRITVRVAAVVEVPYSATNQAHTIRVAMVGEDGEVVTRWSPDGSEGKPVRVQGRLNMGRPPNLPEGESQSAPMVFGFDGVPLAEAGRYSFRIDVNGDEARRLPLRVVAGQS